MRPFFILVCAGALTATAVGPVCGQTATGQTATGQTATGQTATGGPAPADTVTVVGKRPTRRCEVQDSACILTVAREVWSRYPNQVQKFCTAAITDKEHQLMLVDELGLSAWGPPSATGDYQIPPALKTVCDYKPAQGYVRTVSTWAPWAATPSAADLAAAYPRGGRALPGGGDARIYCSIERNGRLEKCSVSADDPLKAGFGQAALRLTGKFRVMVDPLHPRPESDNWVDIAVHFPNPATPAGATQVVHPDWTALPDADATARLFPAAARQAGVTTGVGRVDCQVGDDGALGGCRLAGEEPAGLGFGDAALSAAPAMRANLWSRDGLRTAGAHVVVPLRFNAEDGKSGS